MNSPACKKTVKRPSEYKWADIWRERGMDLMAKSFGGLFAGGGASIVMFNGGTPRIAVTCFCVGAAAGVSLVQTRARFEHPEWHQT
mmetsp:Transcript_14651/g.20350  ORF Transcript_14651/g.20350 Transcript_14651/m.20350 type:complete len:86 (+) Transcript_14651:26-283(+)